MFPPSQILQYVQTHLSKKANYILQYYDKKMCLKHWISALRSFWMEFPVAALLVHQYTTISKLGLVSESPGSIYFKHLMTLSIEGMSHFHVIQSSTTDSTKTE